MLAQPSPRPPPRRRPRSHRRHSLALVRQKRDAAVAPTPGPASVSTRPSRALGSLRPARPQTPQIGSSRPHARAAPARAPPHCPRGASSLALHAPPGSGQLGTNKSVTATSVSPTSPTSSAHGACPSAPPAGAGRDRTGTIRPRPRSVVVDSLNALASPTHKHLFFKSGSMHVRPPCRPSAARLGLEARHEEHRE